MQYINNTWGTNLLREIEYHYFSVRYSNAESLAKRDNKGIKLIKEFVETLYKEMTEERNKRKQWAEKRAATDAFGSSSPNGAGNALYT